MGPWGQAVRAVGTGEASWTKEVGGGHSTRVLGPPDKAPQMRGLNNRNYSLSLGARSPRSGWQQECVQWGRGACQPVRDGPEVVGVQPCSWTRTTGVLSRPGLLGSQEPVSCQGPEQ